MARGVASRTRSRGITRTPTRVIVIAIALLMGLLAALVLALGGGSGADPQTQAISNSGSTTTSIPMAPPVQGAFRSINHSSSAANGRTRIERSLACNGSQADSGYWHFQSENPLGGGVLTAPGSTVPGDLRLSADLHSPFHTIRATPEPVAAPGPVGQSAYLPDGSSRVALSNARGTVKLGLVGGGCPPQTMPFTFDGSAASGVGAWKILSSTGSYRNAAGAGTYRLDAGVLPGADNPWTLGLNGLIAVNRPQLDVRLVETYWGRDGVDYAARQVAAVYQVTNIGAGDSFNAALTAASSPTPGTAMIQIRVNGHKLLIDGNTPVGQLPRSLGDLASGEQIRVTVVWQLPLPATKPPCKAVILGCQIDTSLTFSTPDALDLPITQTVAIPVKAPNLPPPA